MNLGILSLIALLLAIVIGFLRNANVGVLCLGFAMIRGLSFGVLAVGVLSRNGTQTLRDSFAGQYESA